MIDSTYKDTINYYGYFDPGKCYTCSGASDTGNFSPTALANGTNSHNCNAVSGGGRWSGNFLNWASMARMDALRKVLYGGYRSTDTSSSTILQRVYIPSDHPRVGEVLSAADLGNYTPDMTSEAVRFASRCVQIGCRMRATIRSQQPPARACGSRRASTRTRRRRKASSACGARPRRRRTSSPLTPPIRPPAPTSPTATRWIKFTVRVAACVGRPHRRWRSARPPAPASEPVGLLQDFADATS